MNKSLGNLSSFKKVRKYVYGIYDLEKTVDHVTYEIFIDAHRSGRKTIGKSQSTTVDPAKVIYGVGVKYGHGSYAIRRNVKSKLQAKRILDSLKTKIDKLPNNDLKEYNIRMLLIAESKKS